MKTEARRRQATALLIVAGAVLLALLPFAGVRSFTITLLTEALIFAIWAMSLDLMTGYTGMLTFGHAAGFGLGGYAAGYFAREVTADFVASLLVAELVILSVAVPIGFVAIRLSGAAFAIVSLCIAQVFFQIAVAWRSVTEGMDGLVGVPLPTVLGRTLNVGTESRGRDRHQRSAPQVAGVRHVLGHCWSRWHFDGFHEGRNDSDVALLDRVGKRVDHGDLRGARHAIRSGRRRGLVRLPQGRVDDRL